MIISSNSYGLKGVYFRPQWFTPTFSKYAGTLCGGVYVHITDRKEFEALKTSWTMLYHIRTKYSDHFEINKPYVEGKPGLFQYEAGDDCIIDNSIPLAEQIEKLEKETLEFKEISKKYYIY